MKHLQSTTEGTWIEIKQVKLTDEQKTLLMSRDKKDVEDKKTLVAELKTLREVAAKAADVKLAKAKYNEVKPTLEAEDVYHFISIDINDNSGILNCRINGEHKQIRFFETKI